MTATPRFLTSVRGLRRDPEHGKLAGVCAGLATGLGVDALLLRLVFCVLTVATGAGILAYLIAWIVLPVEGADDAAAVRRPRTRRASLEVGLGVGALVLAILLACRELGLPFSDTITWPLALVAAGGALLWRQSVAAPTDADARGPEAGALGALGALGAPAVTDPLVISRVGIGATLVVAAAVLFLQTSGALAAATDAALSALVVAVALAVIFAPFVLRLLKSLTAERAERIRSQERAEVAAHLHDSVLQTLALVQKRADDPREVAALARRQERELRAWLNAPPSETGPGRLARALQDAADTVEDTHGVPVELVAVGDAELDRDGEALVAAAREAMLNAAKFGGGEPVAVYAEIAPARVQVFVRDRGPGFDPAGVPADRRGVRESIVGRMERHGGVATITAAPGAGTEVELVLERAG